MKYFRTNNAGAVANSSPWRAGAILAASLTLVAVVAPGVWAQSTGVTGGPGGDATTPTQPPPSAAAGQTLAAMAAGADAIAVVRVAQTEYARTRAFPSSGWALLEVLVPYRGVEKGQLLEVTERGLGEQRCYYPELGTWQFEGDRFFVFLKKGEGDTWRGRAPACRLPVLVDDANRFLLRFPVEGLKIDEEGVVEEVQFNDPAARVDASDFTRAKIRELEDFYLATRVVSDDPLAPPDLVYQYTRGITLANVRRLMNRDAEAPGK
ncbi:MAG: hypothetical protein AAF358_06205 [Pseudomonadota bacterium]